MTMRMIAQVGKPLELGAGGVGILDAADCALLAAAFGAPRGGTCGRARGRTRCRRPLETAERRSGSPPRRGAAEAREQSGGAEHARKVAGSAAEIAPF